MPERWVINASPIILLAKAEVIHFLPRLCDELVIPAGVVREVERGRLSDAGRQWLADDGKTHVRQIPSIRPELVAWQGGSGEAEVMSWALMDRGCKVVLDDRAARRFAQRLGLVVLGSLRIIVRAKELGFLPAAKPALDRLRGAGAYVSGQLIDLAIQEAGENPMS